MLFDKLCIDKILNGEKTVTRRIPRGKRPAIPGRIHRLKADRTPKTYGLILIKSCDLEMVGDIDTEEVKKEGFNSFMEYIDYFMEVNNIEILNHYDLLWRIEFEVLL